ncbi:MAG: hypothetical protein ACTHJ3_04310 [Pararhizobium sp.]
MDRLWQTCMAAAGAAVLALALGVPSATAQAGHHGGGFGDARASLHRSGGDWHSRSWQGGRQRPGASAASARWLAHHGRGGEIAAFRSGLPAFRFDRRSGWRESRVHGWWRGRRSGHRLFVAPPTLWRSEPIGDGGSWRAMGGTGYRGFDAPYGGDGAEIRVSGLGTYAGGLYAYHEPGNGNFFYVDGDYGGATAVLDRGGPKIVTVTPGIGEAACHREAGVCVIRP